jgi:hypothetical protein
MPKYTVLAKSFIHNRLFEEGEEVDYEGEVSDNLELIGGSEKATPAKRTKKTEGNPEGNPNDLV